MTLDEIVTFCRKNNVLLWKGPVDGENALTELHFGPPPSEAEPEDDVKDVDNETQREKRHGKDGRTAAEQMALYGRVYDAEE